MAVDLPEPAAEPVPLPPRQALQERVAAAILEAAARTFAARGSANLADVAAAAGVARATVYRNRTRLIGELARLAAEHAQERLFTFVHEPRSPGRYAESIRFATTPSSPWSQTTHGRGLAERVA
jgi:AcrR family transcriptional regulator